MNNQNIDVDCYTVCFYIETVHGSDLEFVLDDTADRTGNDYYDALAKMLRSENIDCVEYGAYGSVNFSIRADTIEELSRDIAKANDVVQQWIHKYNVNKMKRTKR